MNELTKSLLEIPGAKYIPARKRLTKEEKEIARWAWQRVMEIEEAHKRAASSDLRFRLIK